MGNDDGGYYAIKGFVYQFDKTIELIIDNPNDEINTEDHQDIELNKYCYQLKYKETQIYTPSKIKLAIINLLNDFQADPTKEYILYAHFKDKYPKKYKLSPDDINNILSSDVTNFSSETIIAFAKNFTLIFSEDYQINFQRLILKIKKIYSLDSDDSAIIYHAIFRSKVIDTVIQNLKGQRLIKKEIFDKALLTTKKIISFYEYRQIIGNERYISLIKKRYFKFKTAHIPNMERLIIIECDNDINVPRLVEIVSLISKKFFRRDNSPPPIICIRNFKEIVRLKMKLLKIGIKFNDGTQFSCDKFDLKYLMEKTKPKSGVTIKFIEENIIVKLLNTGEIDYIYDISLTKPSLSIKNSNNNFDCIKVSLEKTEQIIDLFN